MHCLNPKAFTASSLSNVGQRLPEAKSGPIITRRPGRNFGWHKSKKTVSKLFWNCFIFISLRGQFKAFAIFVSER